MDKKTPLLCRFKRHIHRSSIVDIGAAVDQSLESTFTSKDVSNRSIAIGLGSRGIANYDVVARRTIDWLRQRGARPFVVPAMGSHGGATAAGQLALLAGWGITPETMGVPIYATMNAIEIGRIHNNSVPVFMDQKAHNADSVLVINRIKPHTDFHGQIESGLVKMAVIGLGKRLGAEAIHLCGISGLSNLILPAFNEVIKSKKLLGGVAIVEDGNKGISGIWAARAIDIPILEKEWLKEAKQKLATLPVDKIDVLVVDEIGKEISGTGMDTNVIGRIGILGTLDPVSPRIQRIVVLGLTSKSKGNALGIGLADVTTNRFQSQVDDSVTKANVLTSTFLERGRMPLVASTDAEALNWAIQTCGTKSSDAVIVRVRNTIALEDFYLSAAAEQKIREMGLALVQAGSYKPACTDNGIIAAF